MFECSVYGCGCNGTMLQTVFPYFFIILLTVLMMLDAVHIFTKILVQLDAITR